MGARHRWCSESQSTSVSCRGCDGSRWRTDLKRQRRSYHVRGKRQMPLTPSSNGPLSMDTAVDRTVSILTHGKSKGCDLFNTGDWQRAGYTDPMQADLVLCMQI